jgi:hypothetical protein
MDWERVSVQTMALWRGSPVSWSQTMVVSRWLVIPMLLMVVRGWPWASKFETASSMQVSTEAMSSRGSCSCQLNVVNIDGHLSWMDRTGLALGVDRFG